MAENSFVADVTLNIFYKTKAFRDVNVSDINEMYKLSIFYRGVFNPSMPVLPSYRNQSIDLHSKSIDWFLYEGNTGI